MNFFFFVEVTEIRMFSTRLCSYDYEFSTGVEGASTECDLEELRSKRESYGQQWSLQVVRELSLCCYEKIAMMSL